MLIETVHQSYAIIVKRWFDVLYGLKSVQQQTYLSEYRQGVVRLRTEEANREKMNRGLTTNFPYRITIFRKGNIEYSLFKD